MEHVYQVVLLHWVMDGMWVASASWLLQIMLQWTWNYSICLNPCFQFFFFFFLKFFFWPCCGASGILGPWPEVGPQLPALAARSPNPEMAREAPLLSALSDAYLGEKFLDHLVISCLIFWETATLCKRSCTVYPFIACIWGWHTQPSFGAHSYTVFLCFTE